MYLHYFTITFVFRISNLPMCDIWS